MQLLLPMSIIKFNFRCEFFAKIEIFFDFSFGNCFYCSFVAIFLFAEQPSHDAGSFFAWGDVFVVVCVEQ